MSEQFLWVAVAERMLRDAVRGDESARRWWRIRSRDRDMVAALAGLDPDAVHDWAQRAFPRHAKAAPVEAGTKVLLGRLAAIRAAADHGLAA